MLYNQNKSCVKSHFPGKNQYISSLSNFSWCEGGSNSQSLGLQSCVLPLSQIPSLHIMQKYDRMSPCFCKGHAFIFDNKPQYISVYIICLFMLFHNNKLNKKVLKSNDIGSKNECNMSKVSLISYNVSSTGSQQKQVEKFHEK